MSDKIQPLSERAFTTEIEPSEELGKPGEFAFIALEDLRIDTRYQRELGARGRKTIKQIVEGFSWSKFEPLMVAQDPQSPKAFFAILDGQHRAVSALMHGQIKAVPCIIHQLDLRQQARVYRDINSVITAMSYLQLHHAGVTGGSPVAVAIDLLCKQAGVEIMRWNLATNKMQAHQTVSVKSLGQILRQHGHAIALRVLCALKDAGSEHQTIITAKNLRICAHIFEALPALTLSNAVAFLKEHDLKGQMEIFRETGQAKAVDGGAMGMTVKWAVRCLSENPKMLSP